MNCDYVERHLDAVIDGEVDASGRFAIDQHMVECAQCSEQLAFAQAVRDHLRKSARIEAPAALRARLERGFEAERGGWLRVSSSWQSTASVAAAALLVFGLGGLLQMRGSADGVSQAGAIPMVQDLVRLHNRASTAEVSQPEQVPVYFRQKVGFPVQPVQFRDPGVHFEGARYASVGGRRAATLHYNVRGRRLTVVAFRTPHRPLEGVSVEEHQGRSIRLIRTGNHTVPLVEHDGITYAVVGDMATEDRLHILARAGF